MGMKMSDRLITILLSVAATLTVVASCTSILCGFGVIHIGLGRVPEKEESVASLTDKSSADLTSSDEPESETESDTESGSTTDTTAITTASGMNNQTTANNDKTTAKPTNSPTQPTTKPTTKPTTTTTTSGGDNDGGFDDDEWTGFY